MLVFHDGNEVFPAMWKAIDSATQRVYFETYIWQNDFVGRTTIQKLRNAHERGCEVKVVYDQVGSSSLHFSAELGPLYDCGIDICPYHQVYGRFRSLANWRSILHRDHRKILVADDVGFTGGLNCGEDYASPPTGNGRFRDSHVQISGMAVEALAGVFNESRASVDKPSNKRKIQDIAERVKARLEKRRKAKRKSMNIDCEITGEQRVQVLKSNPYTRRQILNNIVKSLDNAERYVWVTNPYLIPPRKLLRALKKCADRGVDVTIITSGKCDIPLAKNASNFMLPTLLNAGVKIFEYQPRELHAKCIVIDDSYSQIGSYNWDFLSHNFLLEVCISSMCPEIASNLKKQFEIDRENCNEITIDQLKKTEWKDMFIYIFMRIGMRLFGAD